MVLRSRSPLTPSSRLPHPSPYGPIAMGILNLAKLTHMKFARNSYARHICMCASILL